MILQADPIFGQKSAQSRRVTVAAFSGVAACLKVVAGRVNVLPQVSPGQANRYPSPSDRSGPKRVRPAFSAGNHFRRSFAEHAGRMTGFVPTIFVGRDKARITETKEGGAECAFLNSLLPPCLCWRLRAAWTPTASAPLPALRPVPSLPMQPATAWLAAQPLARLAAPCATTWACVTKTFRAHLRPNTQSNRPAGRLARPVFSVCPRDTGPRKEK